jgi:aspartyl-tRNA(Asn)/glutamyl-tRNA(Gln) amidotransferase subunit A
MRLTAYGATVRERLTEGGTVPAWEYAEALQVRARGIPAFTAAMADVDALVAPTLPITAQPLGQVDTTAAGLDESVRFALTRLPGPTNLLGLPSLSLPCGVSTAGLPVGVQLIGRAWSEATLYRVGHALERHLTGGPPHDLAVQPLRITSEA